MIIAKYTLNDNNELYYGNDLLCTFTDLGIDELIYGIARNNLVEYKGNYIRL